MTLNCKMTDENFEIDINIAIHAVLSHRFYIAGGSGHNDDLNE